MGLRFEAPIFGLRLITTSLTDDAVPDGAGRCCQTFRRLPCGIAWGWLLLGTLFNNAGEKGTREELDSLPLVNVVAQVDLLLWRKVCR